MSYFINAGVNLDDDEFNMIKTCELGEHNKILFKQGENIDAKLFSSLMVKGIVFFINTDQSNDIHLTLLGLNIKNTINKSKYGSDSN